MKDPYPTSTAQDETNEQLLRRIGNQISQQDKDAGQYFFWYAPIVLEHAPQHFKQYADTGLQITRQNKIAGWNFFLYAPTILKNAPQHFKQYANTGLQITQQDTDAGQDFFVNALIVLEHAPQHLQEYANTGLQITQQNADAGQNFFLNAPTVLEDALEEYRTPLLDATGKLAQRDTGTALDFLERTPKLIKTIETPTTDALLIGYINDQQSAQLINQLIKPGSKEDYMDKIRTLRFY